MPSRVIRTDINKEISSFEYDLDEWLELQNEVRNNRSLLICCDTNCKSSMLVNRNKKGTQWFSHKPDSNGTKTCSIKDKGETHYNLQKWIRKILMELKVPVSVEHKLEYKDTNLRADLFCEGKTKNLSIEIQLSKQSLGDYVHRTNQYLETAIDQILWMATDHDKERLERVPVIVFCDSSGSELSKIDLKRISSEQEGLYVKNRLKMEPNFGRKTFIYSVEEFLSEFVKGNFQWKSCDLDHSKHWCSNQCVSLKKWVDRKIKEKEEKQKRILEEAEQRRIQMEIQEQKRKQEEAEERAKQESEIKENKRIEDEAKHKERVLKAKENLEEKMLDDFFEMGRQPWNLRELEYEWHPGCDCEAPVKSFTSKPGGSFQFWRVCTKCELRSNVIYQIHDNPPYSYIEGLEYEKVDYAP